MVLVIQFPHCTAIVSLYIINCLVLIMDVHCVLLEVGTAVLCSEWRKSHSTPVAHSQHSTSQHTICIIFQCLILYQAVNREKFLKVKEYPNTGNIQKRRATF